MWSKIRGARLRSGSLIERRSQNAGSKWGCLSIAGRRTIRFAECLKKVGTGDTEIANAVYAALVRTLYRAKDKGGNTAEIHNVTRF